VQAAFWPKPFEIIGVVVGSLKRSSTATWAIGPHAGETALTFGAVTCCFVIYKYMFSRFSTAIIFSILVGVVSVSAQDATPTPTPTPTPEAPVVTVPDTQRVQPENLKGVPAIAPGYSSEDRSLPDLGRVGVDMTEQKPLTVREAIAMALTNNKDIEVTRQNVKIAEFDLQAARGAYEPRFAGQTYYEHTKTPVFSFFGGGPNFSLTQSNFVGNAGITGLIKPTGGSFSVQATNTRNTTNNIFTSVNPTYTSGLSFQFTQPILRGRAFDQNRRTIEVAKKNLSLTDAQFRQRTIEIITNVQRAYWDLTFALRNLQVQRDGVRDAKAQLEHNRRLVEEGQLAPIDIVAAETQVANFEQAVYEALNNVTLAENSLKNFISPNRNDEIWAESVLPVDPVDPDVPLTTLGDALTAALQNRPELELNETQKEINAIDQKFFKEQTKPQVDLIANYTLTGAAGALNPNVVNPLTGNNTTGTVNQVIANLNAVTAANYPNLTPVTPLTVTQTPPLPDYLNGGYGSALGNLFANRYPSFRVGVQFNLPLFGDKTAKAQFGRSKVEGERLETQREQLEQNIQVDVRNALQAVRTAEARLRAAAIARENTAKQYESEQRKLDAGQSDVYKVLERQTALTSARSAELRAQTELNKAIADLQRATGNSLKANNVEARLRH
jgi:HAE1 family hydrophobic/amphiphilic exporter-1